MSCPPRLVAQAGESLLLSCAATAVSEEGVRYRWESVSGDGLGLLSDAASQSPLFTAPVSGAGAEYAYRLTAMAAGVYRTSTVTVTVQGVSGETVRGSGLQEECDPLAIPDEPGQGCVPWERGPDPFGFGEETQGGFLFPEAPGAPDRGGGFDSQSRLLVWSVRRRCFWRSWRRALSSAMRGTHRERNTLIIAWEPVGSVRRGTIWTIPDYFPKTVPNPSVIAPEAPVYETLESFRFGEIGRFLTGTV